MAATEPRYCYRHPDRETGLSCSECGRPICYECMTPAPVGLRCPEHSGKPQGMKRVTAPAQRAVTGVGSSRPFAITTALIVVNVAVYLAELALGGNSDGTKNTIFDHGALVGNGLYDGGQLYGVRLHAFQPGYTMVGVSHGEWWRLFTSPFLHLGIIHLAVNMVSLYFTGRILEYVVGRWKYLLIYMGAGLVGSAGALWDAPSTPTVGASGAIFGVLGALLVLERRGTIHTGGQVLMWIVLNLVLTFTYSGISIGGHIGGLIGGIVLMLAFIQFRRSTPMILASAAVVAAAAIVLAFAVV